MVRDQIVCGIVDKKLRARLLQEKDLTLESAVEICKAAELAAAQNRALESEAKVQRVKKVTNAVGQFRASGHRRCCGYCGKTHEPRRLPSIWENMHAVQPKKPSCSSLQEQTRHS